MDDQGPAAPATPAQALALARSLIRAGQVAEAEALLGRFAADPDCRARLRELHIGEGRGEAARRLLVEAPMATAPATPLDLVVTGLRLHLAGDFAAAAQRFDSALRLEPANAVACNHLGRALHNLGRRNEALAAFERAVALDPDYAEAWHSLGHARRASGRPGEACAAFERALALAPGYRSARLNLGITRFSMDQAEAALGCFRALLERNPADAEALCHAGLCLHLLGDLAASRRSYERAIALAPELPGVHFYLGAVCNELADLPAARSALREAVRRDPRDAEAWSELAGLEETANDLAAAEAAVTAGLQQAPGHPLLRTEAAKLARRRGSADEGLSHLQQVDASRLPERPRQQYLYELGNCLDRAARHGEAWQAFERANATAASSVRARRIPRHVFLDELEALHAHESSTPWPGAARDGDPAGDVGADLCFLIGFPRSGTTLIDTLLDANAAIAAIEERPTFEPALEFVASLPGGYPKALGSLDPATLDRLRAGYRARTAALLGDRSGTRIVLDKLPLRGIHARFMALLFPAARFLFVKRHPCDVVLSNVMQQYAVNPAFVHFYTLEDAVRIYERSMALYRILLPRLGRRVHVVGYEALTQDPAGVMEATCRFLGVDWDPAALEPERRLQERGLVRTNSYHQVAEPIYRRSVARWTNYRAQLAPFLPRLATASAFLGYRVDDPTP